VVLAPWKPFLGERNQEVYCNLKYVAVFLEGVPNLSLCLLSLSLLPTNIANIIEVTEKNTMRFLSLSRHVLVGSETARYWNMIIPI
jgi:hypothetical protein